MMSLDCFCGAVVGPACVEVGHEHVFPLSQGPAQAGDLGDGARRWPVDEYVGWATALLGGVLAEDTPDILSAQVVDFDADVRGMRGERGFEPCALAGGEAITPGAQNVPDLVQELPPAPAVAQGFLPVPAAYPVWRVTGGLNDMEEHPARWWRLRVGHRWRSCTPGTSPVPRSGHRSGTARRARPASSGRPRRTGLAPGPTTWPWDGPLLRSCP